MRNLKRALSLALASVMLLGMMVVGTSAASTSNFTDADKIVNAEAVDLTTGLDIFKGYTDGSFGPEKAVTRAEAAVVIAKILHGSDVNPANFAGAGKFTDVEAWAEGYVNLVSSLGIIVGRGEGIFDPNATVTTVEFSTMLLKALGYYVEADALGADWMLEVTSKANALGLYGDLELAMTAPLTRENVAVLTMNALFAQRVAYDDVRGLYVKNSDRNVVVTNGTVDEYNTLAQNTYGLYAVEGTVVANGMTDIVLEDKTQVIFNEDKDVTGDKVVEESYKFEVATGLDMIGHAATVYYTIEKKAPVVYAIVDEATLAVDAVMTTNLSTLVKAEGFAKDTSDTVFAYNYNLDDTTVTAKNYAAFDGEIVKLISNSSDLTVDYAIVVESDLAYVDGILVNDADEEDPILTYELVAGTETSIDDDKNAIAVNEVEEKDYVLLTKIAGRGINGTDLYLIEAADTEIETIVTVIRNSATATTTKLASEAVEYADSVNDIGAALIDPTCTQDYAVIDYSKVEMKGEYILIFDAIDRLIGVVPVVVDNTVNAAYVAQFGTKINTDPSLYDNYALYAHIYFADGTDGIYTINTGKVDDNAFYGTADEHTFSFENGAKNVDADPKTLAGKGLNAANEGFGTYIKLYDVTIQDNGKALIKELPNQTVKADTVKDKDGKNVDVWTLCNDGQWDLGGDITTNGQIKKGVTWMNAELSRAEESWYGYSKTTFFFVEGTYNLDDGIDVDVFTGMKDVPTVDLKGTLTADTEDNAFVGQASATQKTGYKAIDIALVNGYEFVEEIEGLYYYDEVYKVQDMKDGTFDLTFYLYDFKTGEPTTATYEGFKKDADARAKADGLTNGYYTLGTTASKAIQPYYAPVNPSYGMDTAKDDTNDYVVDATFIKYIDFGDVLTMYTDLNNLKNGVVIDEETVIVDLATKSNITSLETLNRVIEARQKIWAQNDPKNAEATDTATLVYDIVEKDNTVGVIYIVDIIDEYSKDYTGTGTGTATADVTASRLATTGAVELTLKAAPEATDAYYVTLQVFSIENGGWIDVITEVIKNADLTKNTNSTTEIKYYSGDKFSAYMEQGEVYRVVADGVNSAGIKAQ